MVFDDGNVAFAFSCALVLGLSSWEAVTGVNALVVVPVIGVIAAVKIALVGRDVDLG